MKNKLLAFFMVLSICLLFAGCSANGHTDQTADHHSAQSDVTRYCDVENCTIDHEHTHDTDEEHHSAQSDVTRYCDVENCTIDHEHTHDTAEEHHGSEKSDSHH